MYLVLHVGVALLLHIDSNPGVFQTWKWKIYGKGQTTEGCLTAGHQKMYHKNLWKCGMIRHFVIPINEVTEFYVRCVFNTQKWCHEPADIPVEVVVSHVFYVFNLPIEHLHPGCLQEIGTMSMQKCKECISKLYALCIECFWPHLTTHLKSANGKTTDGLL